MANQLDVIRELLLSAGADHPGWSIQGHASKGFLGFDNPSLECLSFRLHEGVIDYWPDELIIRVRAGTPLSDIDQVLEAKRQRMIFEAPRVNGQGTIGGAVAAGLAGPSSPFNRQIRHSLLGLQLLRGTGEAVRFGGEVVKNVAGYDITRLQIGALGIFGPILDVSMKVEPIPEWQEAFAMPADEDGLRRLINHRHDRGLSAAGILGDQIVLRFEGSGANADQIRSRLKSLGYTEISMEVFTSLRDLRFLPRIGWRWEGPRETPLSGHEIAVDWLGGLRYFAEKADAPAEGKLWPYGIEASQTYSFLNVGAVQHGVLARLKATFDPQGIFNPGRLAREF